MLMTATVFVQRVQRMLGVVLASRAGPAPRRSPPGTAPSASAAPVSRVNASASSSSPAVPVALSSAPLKIWSPLSARVAAEVIPVRGVDDVLVARRRVAAGQARDHVARLDLAHRVASTVKLARAGQRHRPEVALQRAPLAARRSPGRAALNSSRALSSVIQPCTGTRRHVAVRRAPGRSSRRLQLLCDHAPRIAGRLGLVDDDRAPPRPARRRSRTCRSSGRSRSSRGP